MAELWKDAGFNVKAFDDIQQLIWEKFICNVSFSAPCTVFDKTIGEVLDDPECWNVSRNCGLEAYNVGLQKEIHFSFDDPVKYIEAFDAHYLIIAGGGLMLFTFLFCCFYCF